MTSEFSKQLAIEIPDTLKPYVATCIYTNSKEKVSLSYPMFATGFPLLIHLAGDKPSIFVNEKKFNYDSNLNIAGQIYDVDVMMSFDNELFDAVGIILFPTTPYYLFHANASEINNKWTSVKDIAQLEHINISDINNTVEVDKRVTIIFEFLINLLKNRLDQIEWLDNSIKTILHTGGKTDVQKLSEQADMSPRNFRRLFKEIIGMPPKYYCKVIQVNTVFNVLNVTENQTLLDIALDCGYYDQSHFIRDFKNFIGSSPNDFFNSDYAYISEYLGVR